MIPQSYDLLQDKWIMERRETPISLQAQCRNFIMWRGIKIDGPQMVFVHTTFTRTLLYHNLHRLVITDMDLSQITSDEARKLVETSTRHFHFENVTNIKQILVMYRSIWNKGNVKPCLVHKGRSNELCKHQKSYQTVGMPSVFMCDCRVALTVNDFENGCYCSCRGTPPEVTFKNVKFDAEETELVTKFMSRTDSIGFYSGVIVNARAFLQNVSRLTSFSQRGLVFGLKSFQNLSVLRSRLHEKYQWRLSVYQNRIFVEELRLNWTKYSYYSWSRFYVE